MKRAPRALQAIIAADPALAAWEARREREQRVTRALRAHLPRQLGERIEARETEGGVIEIATSAGAIAAAVRQRLPDLRAVLLREGFDADELKVRVHVAIGPPPPPAKPAVRRIDRNALAPLAGLARALPPGPLREAIAKLVRRAG